MERTAPPGSMWVLKIARILLALVIAVALATLLPWNLNIPTPGPLLAKFIVNVPAVDGGAVLHFVLLAFFVDCAFFFVVIWCLLGVVIKVVRRPTTQ